MKDGTGIRGRMNGHCGRACGRLLVTVLVGLGTVAMADESPDPAAPAIPALTAPRLSSPPTIDGRIDPVEWREALAVSGVVGASPIRGLLPRPTTFYIGWDADNIYLACRTWIAPNTRPMVRGRERGNANVFDPGLELHIKPLAASAADTDSSYKFFINLLGNEGEQMRVSVGQLFQNWLTDFDLAADFTDPGTAPYGGRWWELEAAMSWEDFELAGPHQAGDQWRLMLGFNHLPGWHQARIPSVGSYFDPAGYCLVTLADEAPAVQVTMDRMPGFAEGQASADVSVFNPSDQPRTVELLARVFDAEGDMVRIQEKLTIAPGETLKRAIDEALAREKGKVHVLVTEGEAVLYNYAADFAVDSEATLDRFLFRNIEEKEPTFAFSSSFNPVNGMAFVQGDAYPLDDPDAAVHVDYRIIRDADGHVMDAGRITESRHHYFSRYVTLSDPAAGAYTIEATMTLADGTVLGPHSRTHQKLDEAAEFAAWWDNDLGDPERVIDPFEAMTRNENEVTVWGRAYQINALGLPVRVQSQGEALLTGAARLVAVIDGQEHALAIDAAPAFTEDLDWRRSFTGTAEGAGLRFAAEGWIEQDGLVYIELTYAPAGETAVTLDALRLEFPLDAKHTDGLMAVADGGNYAPLTTIAISKADGVVWDTLVPGRRSSGMTVGSFQPQVWLGNDLRGFLWWADNDQGWVPDDAIPAHEVIRRGDTVTLRNNIIGKPFELAGSRTIRLSYMASPFRPLPKGWRYVTYSENGTFQAGGHKMHTDPETGRVTDGWNWLSPPSTDPSQWADMWASYKERADAHTRRYQHTDPARARSGINPTHTSLPLWRYGNRTGDGRVTGYFAADWVDNSLNHSQQQYWLYLAHRAFGEGGLKTIYWDIWFADLVGNVLTGHSYVLPDGRVQRGYAGWNARRFLQRLYAVMSDHGLTPGSMMSHASNNYLLVSGGWMDAILDGEAHKLSSDSDVDWVDGYPIDRMRFKSMPHNWGIAMSWMDLIGHEDRNFPQALRHRMRRGLEDYVKLFDTWRHPDGRKMPESMLVFGLNDAAIEYAPFWRLEGLARPRHRDALVSLWRLPDRVIVGVFNNNRADTINVAVDVDLAALGLAGKLVDCVLLQRENDHTFASNGRLQVNNLLPHTGRFYGIRAVDQEALETFHAHYASLSRRAFRGQGTAYLTVPDAVLTHGFVRPETRYHGPGEVERITTDDDDVELVAWQLPDRVLVGVYNAGEQGRNIALAVDLDAMGLTPELPWQEFIRCHGLIGEVRFNFEGRGVTLPSVAAGTGRLFVLRRY